MMIKQASAKRTGLATAPSGKPCPPAAWHKPEHILHQVGCPAAACQGTSCISIQVAGQQASNVIATDNLPSQATRELHGWYMTRLKDALCNDRACLTSPALRGIPALPCLQAHARSSHSSLQSPTSGACCWVVGGSCCSSESIPSHQGRQASCKTTLPVLKLTLHKASLPVAAGGSYSAATQLAVLTAGLHAQVLELTSTLTGHLSVRAAGPVSQQATIMSPRGWVQQ